MSVIQGVAPRDNAPLLHMGWRIPLLKDAVLIEETNGSIAQAANNNLRITVNAGAGPAANAGVFASWHLEDVLGKQLDRGPSGLAYSSWVQRIVSMIEPSLSSDTQIFCCVSNDKDLKIIPNLIGAGIRYSGGTKTAAAISFEYGIKTDVVDGSPTGQTQQAVMSHYELLPGQIGPCSTFGIPRNASTPFDLVSFYFNNGFTGPLYFCIGAYRNNIATAGNSIVDVRGMYATTGTLQTNYVI